MVQTTDHDQASAAPPAARLLGLAGLLPFAGLAAAAVLLGDPWPRAALLGYGATILSFLGGLFWGLALREARPLPPLLVAGVVPQLVGWGALLLGGRAGLGISAAALLLVLVLDRWAIGEGLVRPWYWGLRWPLSAAAALVLAAAAFAP